MKLKRTRNLEDKAKNIENDEQMETTDPETITKNNDNSDKSQNNNLNVIIIQK